MHRKSKQSSFFRLPAGLTRATAAAWLVVLVTLANPPVGSGQAPTAGQTTQVFPQFATGSGWITYITVANPTQQPELVTVELFRSDGSTFVSRVISLNQGGTQTLPIESPSQITVGWARLSSNGR